jgi:hypothetical protein
LNEKRKVSTLCQDALAGLEQAIEAEPVVDTTAERPR